MEKFATDYIQAVMEFHEDVVWLNDYNEEDQMFDVVMNQIVYG